MAHRSASSVHRTGVRLFMRTTGDVLSVQVSGASASEEALPACRGVVLALRAPARELWAILGRVAGEDRPSGRMRESCRALLFDGDNRVLLGQHRIPTGTVWAAVGGGVEAG